MVRSNLSKFSLISLLCMLACIGCISEAKIPANQIYYNGDIITMKGDDPQYVEAVAINNDEIVALGKLSDLESIRTDSTEMIDLEGKTLLPGFIDPHIHPMLATILIQTHIIAFNDWHLPHGLFEGVKTEEAYFNKLKEAVLNHESPNVPFISWGYHELYHGLIRKDQLDELFPEIPVIIWQYSFHEIIMNSAALELLGIDKNVTENHHHIDWKNGRFYETGAIQVAAPKLLPYVLNPQSAQKGMSLTAQAIRNGGITTIGDMAMPLMDFDLELKLLKGILDREEVPFRTFLVPNASMFAHSPEELESAFSIIENLSDHNSDKLQFLPQVKLFADGAFYAQLMQMKEPYTDGHDGAWLMEPDILEQYVEFFWNKDYRIHVHANGDLGVEKTLDILEKVQSTEPKDDHRFTFHHLGYTDREQVKRMSRLGAHASVQPFYVYAIAGKYAEDGLGNARAQSISPVGYFIENDIVTCLHSDFFMAPSEPLQLMWVAVNRKTLDGKTFGKELKVSPYEALKAVTINAAMHLSQEETIGSLELGKKADFVILDKNPLKVDPESIREIEVIYTVFEGKAN